MPQASSKPQSQSNRAAGPGTASDVGAAFEKALLAAVKASAADIADPHVSAAFALGWQMAELYRPQLHHKFEAAPDDLPGLGSLDEADRTTILLDQVEAGLAKLSDVISGAGLTAPSLAAVRSVIGGPHEQLQQAVLTVHVKLLGVLTATDFKCGKAYGLGRALADTCRKPKTDVDIKNELGRYRIANLLKWLDDLSTAFPAHAAHSVYSSLNTWCQRAETRSMPVGTLAVLRRQGELWRALLSGEKSSSQMLEIGNYLDAARDLVKKMRSTLIGVVARFPLLFILTLLLIGGGIALLAVGGGAHIVAGATALFAALGLTWKGLGGALGQLAGKLEQPLWGAVLDRAVADAITLELPGIDNVKDYRGRGELAVQMTRPVVDRSPRPSSSGSR